MAGWLSRNFYYPVMQMLISIYWRIIPTIYKKCCRFEKILLKISVDMVYTYCILGYTRSNMALCKI